MGRLKPGNFYGAEERPDVRFNALLDYICCGLLLRLEMRNVLAEEVAASDGCNSRRGHFSCLDVGAELVSGPPCYLPRCAFRLEFINRPQTLLFPPLLTVECVPVSVEPTAVVLKQRAIALPLP